MAKKKRILIIVENLPVPHDKRVWQEANSLKNAGYDVFIISPKGKNSYQWKEIINGIIIYRHPMPLEARGASGYLIEYPVALFFETILTFYVFLKHGFDVIHACNPPDLIFIIAIFFKLIFKKKFVFDHHDVNPEIWLAKGGKKNFVYKILMLLEKLSFMTADMSLAVNSPCRSIAIERDNMDPAKIFTVRNAPLKNTLDRVFQIHKDSIEDKKFKCIIGYLGVMGKQDDVDNLIYITEIIIKEFAQKDILFKIMGDGPELGNIIELTAKLGLNNNVVFTGWVSGDDYCYHLNSCDICVNADTVNHYNVICSPNKIFEFMSFKKPIVQFDMHEARYMAMDAALYAVPGNNRDFAEKIIELADNPEKRKIMGEYAYQRFTANFTWENSEKELIKAYNYLFSK
jgi:glycosyltransferase involved in cell wall biosynthesis